MRHSVIALLAIIALPAGLLAAGTAAAEDNAACDPGVATALEEGARRGVEIETAVIRNPDQGIRQPESILDLSCIADMFDFDRFDHLYQGGGTTDLLGLIEREICRVARTAYNRSIGQALDFGAWHASAAPQLPGLETAVRELQGPGPAPAASPPRENSNRVTLPVPSSDAERFRQIIR